MRRFEMEQNEAMDNFLKTQKKRILQQKPKYGQCEWALMILKWNNRDWEILVARDPQTIDDYTVDKYGGQGYYEQTPLGGGDDPKMKGIKLRPKRGKLYGGKIRGPRKDTIISLFQIPKVNQKKLKIINLDKE